MKSKERVILLKGVDRIRRGQYTEALEQFDRVLELDVESFDAWNNKGVAYFKMGEGDKAIECYERSLEINPDNLDPLRNIAFVLGSQSRFQEAIDIYDEILARGGDVGDMEAKATNLVGLDRFEEALEILVTAARIKPSPHLDDLIEMLMGVLAGRRSEEQEEVVEQERPEDRDESDISSKR